MRHTSGLTYGLFGDWHVDKMYNGARVLSDNRAVSEFVEFCDMKAYCTETGDSWNTTPRSASDDRNAHRLVSIIRNV